MAAEAKVKEEEVEYEVLEVKEEAEEMVEETVKEEVEKVVKGKAVVGGQWLRVFLGTRDAGAIHDLPWDPAVVACPHPPNFAPPPPRPPGESGWDSPFFDVAGASKAFGAGEVGMGGRGGGRPPGQAPIRIRVVGSPKVVGVATGVARAGLGG